MNEYLEYIKWFGKEVYKKQLEILGYDSAVCLFRDNIDYTVLNKDIIFITDCNSIYETIHKLNKYKEKIEDKFEVLDISIFKGNDNVNLSETYLIAIYCVDKNKYKSNIKQYQKAFKSNSKNYKLILKNIEKILKQDSKKLIEVNYVPQGIRIQNINELYIDFLNNVKRKNRKDLLKLKFNRIKSRRGCGHIEYNYKLAEKNILQNINIKALEELLKVKSNRNIKGYKTLTTKLKNHKKNNIVNNLYDSSYSSIAIINCENDELNKKYIEVFKKLNSKVIVISNNREAYDKCEIIVSSKERAMKLVEGIKAIYITNFDEVPQNKNIIALDISNIKEINYENIISLITSKIEYLNAFSNLDHINSVKTLTGTFFNFDGNNYYSGGAERYLIDLHEVCKQMGMKLRIYQKANFNFFRYYNDIEVVGISNENEQYNYSYAQNIGILSAYNEISKNKTKLNIYSAFLECLGQALSPSIGISHGVAWDYKDNVYSEDCWKDKNWIIESAMSCDKLVSVDTNTANYFQTVDYKLGNTTEVIPNYVNNEEFAPDESKKESSNIVIVYPRRLYEARGLYILLDNTDKLLSKYENIEIHFVGKGFKEDTDKIQEKINKWGNRVKMYNCPPNKMHEVYKKADISVIPTLYSEGTSLSCLEAMSTGNAVIATRVGGLTDLIINNYNGKLIEPNKNSLFAAICDWLDNPETMKKCKANAMEVSKVFSKDIWINSWKKLIKKHAKKLSNKENVYYNITKIYVATKNIDSSKLNKIIFEKLINNNLVYIVNNEIDKKQSYGRIQYIKEDEDLYRNADCILIDKDYENKQDINGEHIEL